MLKIKGVNDNLVIIFGHGTFTDFVNVLHKKLADNINFFKGSKVLFRGEGLNTLDQEEILELQKICLKHGMMLNNISANIERSNNQDLFVYRNIRSGQKLRSEGSLVIWGDVHESAEIAAAGDIIVLGKLEGIAHAGCYGNKNSMVFALSLAPGQIRIADNFSRAPANDTKGYTPEVAYYDGKNICITVYNPKAKFSKYQIIE